MKSTTINIDVRILEQIKLLSEKSGITQTEIIKKILFKVVNSSIEIEASTGLNNYQDHDAEMGFKKVHINFEEDEIWAIKSASLRLKLSVSKMLFLGFLFWFSRLIKSLQQGFSRIEMKIYDSYTSFKKLFKFYYFFEYFFLKERMRQ